MSTIESALARLQLFLGTSEAYKSLFKAGFVLIASAVIALGQFGPEFYTKDLEAHKLKFEAEFAMKQSINKNTDCSKVGQHEVACRNAVHNLKTLESTLSLWESYMKLALNVGVFLFSLGLLGFLMPLFGTPIKAK